MLQIDFNQNSHVSKCPVKIVFANITTSYIIMYPSKGCKTYKQMTTLHKLRCVVFCWRVSVCLTLNAKEHSCKVIKH